MKAFFNRLGRIGLFVGVLAMGSTSLSLAANSATTATPCATDKAVTVGGASAFDTHGNPVPAILYKDVSGSAAVGNTSALCGGTLFAVAHQLVDSYGNSINGFQHNVVQNLGTNSGSTLNMAIAGSHVLGGLHMDNENGASAFVQCFDAQSGNITLGTTKPDVQWKVATVTTVDAMIPGGLTFQSGILCYSTTADQGAITSGTGVHVTAFYN